jgi:IS4 transposase
LHGLLKQVPWWFFDKLVDEHGADARVRRLTTKSQLVALLYGQLSGAASLREIELALTSHAAGLYHLGAGVVSRSTLADANRLRPHEVFSGLFAQMLRQSGRGLRRSGAEAVRLIDSTSLQLSGMASDWARFSTAACGAKAHLIYDPDAATPLYLDVTPARTNDILAARAMPIEPGATYVFDLGYYDFAWWAKLAAAGCRIVTRLKLNTPLTRIEERALAEGEDTLLYDRVGLLPQRQAAARRNPFQHRVREIGVCLDGGSTLRILSNDLDAPAAEIAALYKRRWAIELFFRWVKQTLRIKHFIGRSENAVRIQIAVALIAYLLIKLAKEATRISESILAFARLLRANLMQRRDISRLLKPPQIHPYQERQLTLAW